jgi:galacturan 1,4-alpha-galacturonidase
LILLSSIGSLGKYQNEANVGNIHVKNCSVTGATNGLRIKTWPGAPPSEAYNITFEDVSLINVSNPIIIDQKYCPNGKCTNHQVKDRTQNKKNTEKLFIC